MTSPFGINLHSQISELNILSDLAEGKYLVQPPSLHPSFDTYIVQSTPKIGIFWIKVVSPFIENDAYGNEVRGLKDQVHAQLSKKYGSGDQQDFLKVGSIWNEPREWTQAVCINERFYYSIWQRPKCVEIPEDMHTIFLGTSAKDKDSPNIFIEYASNRYEDARAEMQNLLSDLL